MLGQLTINNNTTFKDKIEIAIDRFKMFEPDEGYYVAFSGGKDSIVIKKLAELAKVKHDTHYNVTTVDPPELIYFIRKHYPKVKFEYPDTTMWKLIPKKKMPPTRLVRYCCEKLKETSGKGRIVVTGVRWAESSRRKNSRALMELNFGNKKTSKQVILNADNTPDRKMLETCVMKSKHVLNPIIDWTDEEVWEFIKRYELSYCELYDQGYKRLGCVGCNMQGSKGMIKDFERYPKFKEAYIRAFERMLLARNEAGLKTEWKSGQEVFDWWVST
jgi:phosphoadenosine phosphosulfate reductase